MPLGEGSPDRSIPKTCICNLCLAGSDFALGVSVHLSICINESGTLTLVPQFDEECFHYLHTVEASLDTIESQRQRQSVCDR